MLLESCETIAFENPPPAFGGAHFVFVRLVASNGIEGYGEAYCGTFSAPVVCALIEDVFERVLAGERPDAIERFTHRAWSAGYVSRPDVSLGGAISALEMACWDLVGKALERPVHALLGGAIRERVRTYTYLYPSPGDSSDVYADAELATQRARERVADGFTAVKFDPAGPYTAFDPHQPSLADVERSREFVQCIRRGVGAQADLLFGTHGQFTSSGALRLARALEDSDPLWFEEPVPAVDETGLARVCASTSIPVAAGERLTTLHEFQRALAAGVQVLQPNLGRCGGLLEARKIAALAEAHGALVAPHLYCGPIVAAANLQLASMIPNFLILEAIERFDGVHAALLRDPLQWEDGHVRLPDAPGLGVELNLDVARSRPVTDRTLHLSPGLDPPH